MFSVVLSISSTLGHLYLFLEYPFVGAVASARLLKQGNGQLLTYYLLSHEAMLPLTSLLSCNFDLMDILLFIVIFKTEVKGDLS